MRKQSPLPNGYRVDEVEGYLRLFSPHGILLQEEAQGPDAASAVEARAWQDAWEQVQRELKEELHALREGIRPLHELRRLRQYMRMLDAMNGVPVEAQERPNRTGAVAWLALAASAAAIAGVVLTTPLRVAQNPEVPQVTTSLPSAARPSAGRSIPGATTAPERKPASSGQVRSSSATRPAGISSQPARPVRAAASAAGPAIRGYAVTFGEFASHTAAEINMHLIRGKGYLVYVTRIGDSFQVATRPYRTRVQAERLANALQEIGLPARMKKAETPAL